MHTKINFKNQFYNLDDLLKVSVLGLCQYKILPGMMDTCKSYFCSSINQVCLPVRLEMRLKLINQKSNKKLIQNACLPSIGY